MSGPRESRPAPRQSLAWWILLGVSAGVVTIGDIVLLREATGFLTSGYNTVSIGSAAEIVAFLGASLVLDVALVLVGWGLVLPALAALGLSDLQRFCVSAAVGMGIPLALSAAQYNLYSIAGDMFNVTLANRFGSPTWSSMAIEVFEESQLVWVAVALLAGAALVWAIAALGRYERSLPISARALRTPRSSRAWLALIPFAGLAAIILFGTSPALARYQYGLKRKPSSALMRGVAHWVSDVDRDGFDLLTVPRDHSPWDATIHPYALEEVGNGIDEDGIGGDLLAERSFASDYPPLAPRQGPSPHVLLIYLESFRADLLEQAVDGRPVTPFLRKLAQEGAISEHAYVHSPWTLNSRAELFSGRFDHRPGESSLIDDFKAWGYTVAYFSGQDESYGDSETLLGTDRADSFYDARQDVDRRTSRSTAPASLQVSWKTLLERVNGALPEIPVDRPLFLYVNIVDTHFPYDNDEVDDLLGVAPLRRDEIRSHSADRVLRSYANTAANVDRAVERVVAAFRARIGDGDHAILILSDHGEAFYEEGMLGHGQSISPGETRVPLIVWGIGGEWPEPIAPTDIRGLLRRFLGDRGAATPRARFVADPGRRIFQFVPGLSQPRVIALRGLDETFAYDFDRARFERIDADGVRTALNPEEHPALFSELVFSWESLKLARARPRDP